MACLDAHLYEIEYKPYTSILNLTVPGLKIMGVRLRSIRPKIMPVWGNIAKKFGFEKLTGFLNYKSHLICPESVAGLEHFEIPK
jgi:hypothetical protein